MLILPCGTPLGAQLRVDSDPLNITFWDLSERKLMLVSNYKFWNLEKFKFDYQNFVINGIKSFAYIKVNYINRAPSFNTFNDLRVG